MKIKITSVIFILPEIEENCLVLLSSALQGLALEKQPPGPVQPTDIAIHIAIGIAGDPDLPFQGSRRFA